MSKSQSSKFILILTTATLYTLGIFADSKLQKYEPIHLVGLLIVTPICMIGSIIGFPTSHQIGDKLEALTYLLCLIVGYVFFTTFYQSKRNITKLLIKLSKYDDQQDQTASQKLRSKIIWILIGQALLIFLFVTPSIFVAFRDTAISDKHSFIIPFWFSCGHQNNGTILQALCWRVRTKRQLLLSNFIQITSGGPLLVIVTAVNILYFISANKLSVIVPILKNKMQNLMNLMNQLQICSQKATEFSPNQQRIMLHHEKDIYEYFIEIVKYQQCMNSCIIDFVSTWKAYVSVYVTAVFIVLVMFPFEVVTELQDAPMMVIRAMSATIIGFTGYVWMCTNSQIISELNEVIMEEMCNIPWYEQNMKFRKAYLIALCLNQKKIQTKVFNIYQLNFSSIIVLLKTGYSILNLMLLRGQA